MVSPPFGFFSSHGIRQGDPLSPYLFAIASQNLTAILNKSLEIDMVLSFNSNLSKNFNHLMYADDLILITKANRKTARNWKLCLDIFAHLSGQVSNPSESTIYFPSWINKRLEKSIPNILDFKKGDFPFTYLGVLIVFKKLRISGFQPMISLASKTVARWSHNHL